MANAVRISKTMAIGCGSSIKSPIGWKGEVPKLGKFLDPQKLLE